MVTGMLSFTACLDPIELKIPKGFEETLIIQGSLIKGNPSTLDLSVTRLFDFTVESLTRVNVSEVILSDESGNAIEIERIGTGIYRQEFDGDESIEIEENKSYKINIRTFDGRSYESSMEPLLPVPKIDSLSIKGIEKESVFSDGQTTKVDSFARLSLFTPTVLPNTSQPVSLKWDIQRIYKLTDSPIEFGIEQKTCFIREAIDITRIKVFDAKSVQTSNLEDFEIFDQRFDFSMSEGLYFELVQSSLSEGAFDYFNQVRQVLEREGNMFEAPAGKIVTNFVNTEDPDEEVFGYFYATSTDTARIFVSPEFANHPQMACPPPFPVNPDGTCAVLLCCDCLSVENSTTIQPGFWKE